jgi:hypothetical protein
MSLLILFDTDQEVTPPIPPVIPPPVVVDINVYSRILLHVEFSDEIIVNDLYNDPSNYSISVVDGTGEIEVVGVLQTNQNASLDVILITQPMNLGTTYSVSATELQDRNNNKFSIVGNFISRNTKVDSLLRSIPKHFDKRPTSILSALLIAIGVSDDIIGGSRDDSIVYS